MVNFKKLSDQNKIKRSVESFLKDKHEKTAGHCGTTVATLKNELGIELVELRKILNQLYKEKKITIHDGIHGKLVKYEEK